MSYVNRGGRGVHAGKLERWLGAEKIDKLVADMRGWYGPPINIRDVPGSVWITGDGDFIGDFGRGAFASALDNLRDHLKQFWARVERERAFRELAFGVGFSSISDALARASAGYSQTLNGGTILKTGALATATATGSLWRVGVAPAAGATSAAAPGGAAPTSATTGACVFNNPGSGTTHLIGADFSASLVNSTLLMYDRIFNVAKTMNSTAAENVTGLPTRYQSTVASDPDYAGGNFLFPEVGGTVLANTAHSWTGQYTNQAGTTAQVLPTTAGFAACQVDRLDIAGNPWFLPLAAGDIGVKALTRMQCSALVATGVLNFVIGHPLGFMAFPVASSFLPFDWLTNRELAPRIFDNACIAFIEPTKPAGTACNYLGRAVLANAA